MVLVVVIREHSVARIRLTRSDQLQKRLSVICIASEFRMLRIVRILRGFFCNVAHYISFLTKARTCQNVKCEFSGTSEQFVAEWPSLHLHPSRPSDIAGTRKRGRPLRRWTDDIKDWTKLPVSKCMKTAQDRTAWRARVSLALTFDPQEWGRTSPVQSSPYFPGAICDLYGCKRTSNPGSLRESPAP